MKRNSKSCSRSLFTCQRTSTRRRTAERLRFLAKFVFAVKHFFHLFSNPFRGISSKRRVAFIFFFDSFVKNFFSFSTKFFFQTTHSVFRHKRRGVLIRFFTSFVKNFFSSSTIFASLKDDTHRINTVRNGSFVLNARALYARE
jgi:hypothetical protein